MNDTNHLTGNSRDLDVNNSSSSSNTYRLSKNLKFNLNNFKLTSLINISNNKFDMMDLKLNGIKYKPQAWHEDASSVISNYKVAFPQFASLKPSVTMHKKTSSSPAPPSIPLTSAANSSNTSSSSSSSLSVSLSSIAKPSSIPANQTTINADVTEDRTGSEQASDLSLTTPLVGPTDTTSSSSSGGEETGGQKISSNKINANSTRLSNNSADRTAGTDASSIYFSPINGSARSTDQSMLQHSVVESASDSDGNKCRVVAKMSALDSSTGALCTIASNENSLANLSSSSSSEAGSDVTPTESYAASNSDDMNSESFRPQSMSVSITKEDLINVKLSKKTTTTAAVAASKHKSSHGEKSKTRTRREKASTATSSESKEAHSPPSHAPSTIKRRRSKPEENASNKADQADDFNLKTASLIDLTTTSISAGQLKDMNDYFYVSSEEFIESLNCDSTCANQSQHNHKNLKHNRSYLNLSNNNSNINNLNIFCNGVEYHPPASRASEERATSLSPARPNAYALPQPSQTAAAAPMPLDEYPRSPSPPSHVSRHVRPVEVKENDNIIADIFSWFAELAYVLITNFKYWCIFTITSVCFLILFMTKFFILSLFSVKNIGMNLVYSLVCKIVRAILPLSFLGIEAPPSSKLKSSGSSVRNVLSSKSRSSSNLHGGKHHHGHHHGHHHHHRRQNPSYEHSPPPGNSCDCESFPTRSLQNISLSGPKIPLEEFDNCINYFENCLANSTKRTKAREYEIRSVFSDMYCCKSCPCKRSESGEFNRRLTQSKHNVLNNILETIDKRVAS